MKKTKQQGFSALHILLVIVSVAIIAGAGWFVYQAQEDTDKTLSDANSVTPATPGTSNASSSTEAPYKTPAGYMQYENKEAGFSLAYPEAFGSISVRADGSAASAKTIRQVDETSDHYHGDIQIHSYGANESVQSRKYGPKVAVKDGKIIVTEANPSDTIGNKVGDEYKDFERQLAFTQTNASLKVFLLKGGDEGATQRQALFVQSGKLHVVLLPTFSNGQYGYGEGGPFDQTAYDLMISNIMKSIRPL